MIDKDQIQVDAVITWVDGNDKKWQQKINTYLENKIDFSKKKESVRYNSIGEINMAIKSIIKFAPFIRNIFLVTDDQVPQGIEELKDLASSKNINLRVVDHKVIFKDYEAYLPTFNSCTIGSMLFRIPDLSNHFIVFNDDTFLMSETRVDDFFKNGLPVVRGKWESFYEDRLLRKWYYGVMTYLGFIKKKKETGFKKFQQTSARLAEMPKYLRRFHTPVSVRRKTLEKFFENNDLLENNIKYRFRDQNQFIISSLSEHLELKSKTCYYKQDLQLTYFRSYKSLKQVKQKLETFMENKNDLFMTFQSLELADKEIIVYISNWIDNRLSFDD